MIWFKPYTLESLSSFRADTGIAQLLGVKIIEIGEDYVLASMPVDSRTHQINGILHGGATCVLVETAGSVASFMCIDISKYSCVGSQISVNHLRPVESGLVIATCKAVHLGRQKHVWDILVHSEQSGKLVAKGELTCAVLPL